MKKTRAILVVVWEPYFGGDIGAHIENVGNRSYTDIGIQRARRH